MKHVVIWLIISVSLYSCVGTDFLDDPKDSAILVNAISASVEIGDTYQIEASYYYNMWQEEPDVVLNYRSNSPSVATVSESGLVTGVSPGQTQIVILYPGEDTVQVSVTVVGDVNDVAEVVLSAESSSIDVGASITIGLEVYNLNREPFTGEGDTIWSVSNESVARIDQSGVLTGLSDGSVEVTCSVDGVSSQPLPIMVGVQARTATFVGVGSYQAVGTATLAVNDSDQLILTFSSDFATSFALGTFAYLANSTAGTTVRAQGLEIAEITENGGKQYNISAIEPDVSLEDYRYVIILCKPASITFGYADLN